MTDIVDKSEAPARRGYLATSHAPGCVPTVPSNKLNCGGCRRLNGSVFGRLEATVVGCGLRAKATGSDWHGHMSQSSQYTLGDFFLSLPAAR
jgi:hypothetical protein